MIFIDALDQIVILRVAADPEPEHAFLAIDLDYTMAQSDARRPKSADSLEVKRWMPRI
ncbi:MAG TPA: hypothetical protein VNU44_17215 [Bryobacteraceae bacterium]|jgi:hypothetical protein|nr:hypothetical protein [Bryobacteraceae bacterium]